MLALKLVPMSMAILLAAQTYPSSRHEAHVTGATVATLAGHAVFGPVRGARACLGANCSASFSLELGAYSDDGAVVFSRVGAGRPKVGVYHVAAFGPGSEDEGELHALVSLGAIATPTGVFRAVSGTVTISQSSDDRIVGRYEVKAVGFLAADPDNENREVTVRGGFTAEPSAQASMFEATTHGAIQVSARGAAEFGTVGVGSDAIFSLNLGAYSEQGAVVLSRRGGMRPVVGVYPVRESWQDGAGAFNALIVTGSPSQPTGVFHATSGTVTITAASVDRVTGTFELHGTGFLAASPEQEGRELTISGSFSAAAGGTRMNLSAAR